MNDTKGGGPIKPVRPVVPRGPKTNPPSGARRLPPSPGRPASMAPPPAPRPKHSITPPKRPSDDREINDFFKAKPDSEPPSGRMSIEIDVDAELAGSKMRSSEPISILVEFEDPVSEIPADPTGPNFNISEHLVTQFTRVLLRLKPSLEGKKLEFRETGIFLESEKVGDVKKSLLGLLETRIWMHKIGFTMDSLPASAIVALFNIKDFFFSDALERAKYVSVSAKSTRDDRVEIKLCFHKEETPSSFLSPPLRGMAPAK
ncbi:MAG: hypothetical protein GY852_04150 [bacterium]|nr:hypothetical protein [bacterium]